MRLSTLPTQLFVTDRVGRVFKAEFTFTLSEANKLSGQITQYHTNFKDGSVFKPEFSITLTVTNN